jgi:hypothetical protein
MYVQKKISSHRKCMSESKSEEIKAWQRLLLLLSLTPHGVLCAGIDEKMRKIMMITFKIIFFGDELMTMK